MPASRPSGSWVRFAAFGLGDIKEFQNDFWYSVTSGSISATTDFNALSTAFWSVMGAAWQAAITTSTTLRGTYGEFSDGTNTFSYNYYHNLSGTGIGDTVPEDVAVVVRKETANGTRAGKGRWYFAGAGTGDTIGSYLNNSGITDWQGLAIACKTAVTGGGVTLSPAHFSRKLGVLIPIHDTPVISLLGTRRRRRGPF